MQFRLAEEKDWPQLWSMIHQVFKAGDTYPHSPDTTEEGARRYWIETARKTYVAVEGDMVLGSYYLRDNQVDLGSHVCNAGYMVCANQRGKGVGLALGQHSLTAAKEASYEAMQFNLVVSTNEASLKIWKKLQFTKVGVLPKAFNHRTLGKVDAYVMHRLLDDI